MSHDLPVHNVSAAVLAGLHCRHAGICRVFHDAPVDTDVAAAGSAQTSTSLQTSLGRQRQHHLVSSCCDDDVDLCHVRKCIVGHYFDIQFHFKHTIKTRLITRQFTH